MADRPTVASIAKELKLSRWLFAIFAVIAGILSAIAYFIGNRVEGGWIVATFVGALAWALVGHFAEQLGTIADTEATERSNSTPHTDARATAVPDQPPSARAGERGR